MFEALDKRMELGDKLVEICREAKRKAARAIEDLVEGRKAGVSFEEDLKKIEEIMKEDEWIIGLYFGLIRVTLQEIAEAMIVKEAVENNRIIIPNVVEHSALTGLADAIGELKRYFLKCIIKGNREEAERVLKLAEEGYRILADMNYPQTIVPELKRKRDVARGVLVSMLQIMAEAKIKC